MTNVQQAKAMKDPSLPNNPSPGPIDKLKNMFMSDQFQIQSMIIPGLIFLFVFAYIPMYGVIIAFKDYGILSTISDAPFVGLKYFQEFLTDPKLGQVLKNTLVINGLGLLFGFPAPIILAILINEVQWTPFKKLVQTVSYLPHFLSWVIFGGLVLELLQPGGAISDLLVKVLGLESSRANLMAQGDYFYAIFTIISIVKTVGYGSILYVAAIAGIDQSLYEAATVDGCNRLQKMWYITLPCILGTIVIMFIFQISSILNTGYEQIIILQNQLNIDFSETLDTYVYKVGMQQMRYSYATAVGLLKSILSVVLMTAANWLSNRTTGKGLF